jgi:hypothetical protein
MKITLMFFIVLLLSVLVLQFLSDTHKNPNVDEQIITDPYLLEGKRLSEIHCTSCHKYPDPGLLPWETWRFETLREMAPFLGVNQDGGNAGQGSNNENNRNPYIPENIYPSEPQVTQEEWQKIQDYYLQMSPKEWPKAEKEPQITSDSLFFRARFPLRDTEGPPQVTAIKFDQGNRLIYLSDAGSRNFMAFNSNLDLVHQFRIESPLSNIRILNDATIPGSREFLFTFIGVLYPSDAPYGSVANGWYDPDSQVSRIDSVLLDEIVRPVESQYADLDHDGLEDLIVNEFGHRGGSLFWLKNNGEGGQTEKKELINTPGCIQSHILDYNGNGKPDILALCTQTSQAVYLFSNKGNGELDRKTLLTFEVTAGSSSFEIHDFNEDGHLDILYTSGDNADFSKIFKPYHGVYIFLNDGSDQFTKEWFYPINGAYNAKARDFDGDGLLDLAVISYFADYENSPEEGFVYFKNEGDFSFIPFHHPAASQGRWMTMDVADWTGNGRDDIILANFPEGPMQITDSIRDRWKTGPYFLLLENQSGK